MIIIALWLAASVLVCWFAGRFIRVGMIDLQLQDRLLEVDRRPRYVTQSATETCVGCRHDDRSSGPINLVDLRPMQLCHLNQPRLWSDRRCERFEAADAEKRRSCQKSLDSRKTQQ